MGLDIVSEDDHTEIWRGAYTAFACYRGTIGALFGMRNYAQRFGALPKPLNGKDDCASLIDAEFQRLFEHRPELTCFFTHSDCDGKWTPTECEIVIALLKEVKWKLPIEDHWGHIGNWTKTTDKFIEGLQYCVTNNQHALFC